jgi:hypothetical protein
MVFPFTEAETIIEREFLAGSDVASRDDPDATAYDFDAAIRPARVVDQSGDVAREAAVQIVTRVEFENIHTVVLAAPPSLQSLRLPSQGFPLRNAFSDIFDNARAIGDRAPRVNAAPVNCRAPGGYPR